MAALTNLPAPSSNVTEGTSKSVTAATSITDPDPSISVPASTAKTFADPSTSVPGGTTTYTPAPLGKMAPSVMGVISTSPVPSSYLPESPSTG